MRQYTCKKIVAGLVILVSGILGILLATGCGDTAEQPNNANTATMTVAKTQTTPTTPKTTPTIAATQPAPPVAAQPAPPPPPPSIVGFGATIDDWNANHVADSRYGENSVYNPTPGLGSDAQHNSKYYAVMVEKGRVLGYSMKFPNGCSLSVSQAELMQEFPPDAAILWQSARTADPSNACYQLEIKSPILGTILSDPAIGDPEGLVFVEFTSDSPGAYGVYDPSNVNGAILMLGNYQAPASAPQC